MTDISEHHDLKQWRSALGLNQDQAAFLLGVTRQGYQKKEKRPGISWETRYAARYLLEHPEVVEERLKDFVPTQ